MCRGGGLDDCTGQAPRPMRHWPGLDLPANQNAPFWRLYAVGRASAGRELKVVVRQHALIKILTDPRLILVFSYITPRRPRVQPSRSFFPSTSLRPRYSPALDVRPTSSTSNHDCPHARICQPGHRGPSAPQGRRDPRDGDVLPQTRTSIYAH